MHKKPAPVYRLTTHTQIHGNLQSLKIIFVTLDFYGAKIDNLPLITMTAPNFALKMGILPLLV